MVMTSVAVVAVAVVAVVTTTAAVNVNEKINEWSSNKRLEELKKW